MKDNDLIQLVVAELNGEIDSYLAEDSTPFATIKVKDHLENHAINSQEFRRWLRTRVFEIFKIVCSSKVVTESVDQFSGIAQIKGKMIPVSVRVAALQDTIIIDKGDPEWTGIEVNVDGFSIIERVPDFIRFRRAAGMKSLPDPEDGGSMDLLRERLNLEGDYQWHLIVPWLLSALRPKGPYPILVVNGGPGSGKSTFTSFLRSLIDPNLAALRSLPRGERDLFIAASNSHLFATDNVSFMSDLTSDVFCRISTGGGYSTRMLRTDDREKIFDVCRPTLFNGIQEFCLRSDFGDRAIQITLPRIHETRRRRSHELLADFERDKGKIFGAVLTSLSRALRELPNVQVSSLPRMADFAHFGVAVEKAMGWQGGTVLTAYENMQKRSNETLPESWPFSSVIITLAKDGWEGTATALLDEIERKVSDSLWHRNIPKNPVQLSGNLRRLAHAFASRGIELCCDGKTSGTGSRRFISIRMLEDAITPDDPAPNTKNWKHPVVDRFLHSEARANQ